MSKRINPNDVRRMAEKLKDRRHALDQFTSTVVQDACKELGNIEGMLRRLAREMEEPRPAKLPRGWALTETKSNDDKDEMYLVAPDCNPGMTYLDPQKVLMGKGPLAERMLIALCNDILAERVREQA